MKVLYDFQTFSLQRYGGISRYFCEMFNYYSKNKIIDFNMPILYSNNENLKNINLFKIEKYKDLNSFLNEMNKIKRLYYKVLLKTKLYKHPSEYEINKKIAIKYFKKESFDIFHPTYYDDYFLEYLNGKPYVLTVYDMIHELFCNLFYELNDKNLMAQKKRLITNANRIIAISENTKKDIVKLYNIPEDKVSVVYLGNSLDIKSNFIIDNLTINLKLYTFLKNYLPIPDNYILYVGNRTIYKNFNYFLYSISPLLKSDKDLYLILAGGEPIFETEMRLFDKLGITDKVLKYNIDDLVLSYLYSNALCFVFPSLYEGFGIPLLEAFSCGCPVVCSNTSSFPEVAGDAAIYFDPTNSGDILEKVKMVIDNKDLREELINKGKERVKFFSWEKCALETYEVYKKVLNS